MVFGDVNFTSILHHLLEMLLESHLRLTMSVLCCFSLDVLRLTGAAPTIERSITTEQCPGRRLQIPQIFLHTSNSHLCLNCFTTNPMMLRSTRLRQRGCTLVASLITIHSRRSIRAILVQRKNVDPLVVTITLNFCMLSLHNLTIFFSYACQILYTVMLNM